MLKSGSYLGYVPVSQPEAGERLGSDFALAYVAFCGNEEPIPSYESGSVVKVRCCEVLLSHEMHVIPFASAGCKKRGNVHCHHDDKIRLSYNGKEGCKLTGLHSNAPFEVEFELFFSKSFADCCLWRAVRSFHLTPLHAVSPLRYLKCIVAYAQQTDSGFSFRHVAAGSCDVVLGCL